MSPKKVNIGLKPGGADLPTDVDQWVSHRAKAPAKEQQSEPLNLKMKRLTIDIPETLHRAIKRKAAEEGATMVDLLRSLLEKHYGDEQS